MGCANACQWLLSWWKLCANACHVQCYALSQSMPSQATIVSAASSPSKSPNGAQGTQPGRPTGKHFVHLSLRGAQCSFHTPPSVSPRGLCVHPLVHLALVPPNGPVPPCPVHAGGTGSASACVVHRAYMGGGMGHACMCGRHRLGFGSGKQCQGSLHAPVARAPHKYALHTCTQTHMPTSVNTPHKPTCPHLSIPHSAPSQPPAHVAASAQRPRHPQAPCMPPHTMHPIHHSPCATNRSPHYTPFPIGPCPGAPCPHSTIQASLHPDAFEAQTRQLHERIHSLELENKVKPMHMCDWRPCSYPRGSTAWS